MAKRMGFSVIGLPHYTIWHLYEPSVDDLRHMEEMEQERKAREEEEKEQAEREERVHKLFRDPKTEWDIDNAFVQDSMREEAEERKAAEPFKDESTPRARETPEPKSGKPADQKEPKEHKAPQSPKNKGTEDQEEAPAIKPAENRADGDKAKP